MANEFLTTLGGVFSSVLILSLLVEPILSGTWNKMYFTSGLPIFVKRISVGLRQTNIPLASRFEEQFQSGWQGSLVFREIEPSTYGFREKFFQFQFGRITPLMHGYLFFDNINNQVVVKGFANWTILWFSLICLSIAGPIAIMSFPEFSLVTLIALGSITFLCLFTGVLYWIQYDCFSKVATFAAQEWKRRYTINIGGA